MKETRTKRAPKASAPGRRPARQASPGQASPGQASPGQASDGNRRLELAEVERLLVLMESHGVAEFEQEEAGWRLRIRLRLDGVEREALPRPAAPAPPAARPEPAAGEVQASTPPAAPAAPAAEAHGNTVVFPSPMVGTFYSAPAPDAEPYVERGDRVGSESTVCIIEAMKVMNEIKAEMEAEVAEILVENGQAVEFGQPLFVFRPL